ncbi:MAG TPA: helix-turn-helix domain-containing protein [Candidatus Saccharimonadia bacterium]|nr:helix-turn-helix domain-containing protein [Candidatus Saccharimonadia bacterium]
MQLNTALARQISDKANQVLKRDLLIADLSGQILAGGPGRAFVSEALSAAQTGRPTTSEFEERQTKWWPFVYDERTIAVFGLPLDTGPITQEATTLLQGLAEVIVYQHFLLDKIQSAERVRADFVRTLLTAPTIDAADIHRQADILQLNVRGAQAVILIHLDGFETSVRSKHPHLSSEEQQLQIDTAAEAINILVRDGFKNLQENLMAYLGEDRFVLLKGLTGETLTTLNTIRQMTEKAQATFAMLGAAKLDQPITLGIGQYYPDLGGLRKSYQDAKLALEVGSKVWGTGRVYHIKQVGMFITLAATSQDRKAELAHQILSPLLRDEQLFKTVQAFLSCGLNLTDAAEKLHIHRNTLIYRLDKTKKLINLDPRHFDDALQIKLGLMFYQDQSVA